LQRVTQRVSTTNFMKARGPVRYRVEKATAVIAAKQATSIIPIVFAIAADPIGTGLVASLARPGGNVTGLSIQSTDVAAKRLALLREVVPSLRRLAIVANFGNPASALESGEVQTAARALGLEVITVEIRRAEDITPAFEAIEGRADAVYVPTPMRQDWCTLILQR
jgi:putative ABC transport system substrate-binding protein